MGGGARFLLTTAARFFSYHLKGVCNSNCGVHHAHRCLPSREHGLVAEWKAHFLIMAPPPLLEVDTASLGAKIICTRSRRIMGGQGYCGCKPKNNSIPQFLDIGWGKGDPHLHRSNRAIRRLSRQLMWRALKRQLMQFSGTARPVNILCLSQPFYRGQMEWSKGNLN